MATNVMESATKRSGLVAMPNREGVKVCPRCGAKTFADMDICYGCLYDFTTGEGEVSLEGIRHENERESWGSTAGYQSLDEPDFCLSDIAELALPHDGAGVGSSSAPTNGPSLRPDDIAAVEAASLPGGTASATNGGVPHRMGCCFDGVPCIRVVASDVPIVVEVMGPSVTIKQLSEVDAKACSATSAQGEAGQ